MLGHQKSAVTWLALALFAAGGVKAGVGDMDPSYGVGGVAPVGAWGFPPAALGDGSLLYQTVAGGRSRYGHTDIHGRPDPDFGDDGLRNLPRAFPGTFNPTTLRTPDGGLLLGGSATSSSGMHNVDSAIVRFTADGSLDNAFGANGLLTRPSFLLPTGGGFGHWGDSVGALAVQRDGRILAIVTSYWDPYEDPGHVVVRRFLPNGTDDLSFGMGTGISVPIASYPTLCCESIQRWTKLVLAPDERIHAFHYKISTPTKFQAAVLDTQGVPQLDPPVDIFRPNDVSHWSKSALLANDAMLFAGFTTDGKTLVLTRLLATRALDTSFGNNGIARISLSSISLDDGSSFSSLMVLSPSAHDGLVYIAFATYEQTEARNSQYVLRLHGFGPDSGRPDTRFGERGVAYFDNSVSPILDIVPQPNAGAIVNTLNLRFRLLDANTPSPGLLGLVDYQSTVSEDRREIQITVSRILGRDGLVSVDYATAEMQPEAGIVSDPRYWATSGEDFQPVTGRLTWAPGDRTAKTIVVPIVQDNRAENAESFQIVLSNASGGAGIIATRIHATIDASAGPMAVTSPVAAPITAPPSNVPAPSASGGGGAIEPLLLLVLLVAWSLTKRRDWSDLPACSHQGMWGGQNSRRRDTFARLINSSFQR